MTIDIVGSNCSGKSNKLLLFLGKQTQKESEFLIFFSLTPLSLTNVNQNKMKEII